MKKSLNSPAHPNVFGNVLHAQRWSLRLFVAGETALSAQAVHNLNRLVAEYLPKNAKVRIIDLTREYDPEECQGVIAVPLLIRDHPDPIIKILGDLSDLDRVARVLGLPLNQMAV